MKIENIPFCTTDWSTVKVTEVPGVSGTSYWRTLAFGDVNLHMAEYTPGYKADHWCNKGHFLLCLEGELHTELKDGRKFVLKQGMTYQVADETIAHRSSTETGAKLYIVD